MYFKIDQKEIKEVSKFKYLGVFRYIFTYDLLCDNLCKSLTKDEDCKLALCYMPYEQAMVVCV